MLNIGIFDDSKYVRETWVRYVEELGHQPYAPLAKSSREFLADIAILMKQPTFRFHGVILDMQFKDGDRAGRELWLALAERFR